MGKIERPDNEQSIARELCGSKHFYAAYVFDQAESHQIDITTIINESKRLGYPVRYWWLSQAMDIQDDPDRLIVCVHHPSHDENAGMDLYGLLHEKQVSFTELDSAVREEYVFLGKVLANSETILKPDGLPIFRT